MVCFVSAFVPLLIMAKGKKEWREMKGSGKMDANQVM